MVQDGTCGIEIDNAPHLPYSTAVINFLVIYKEALVEPTQCHELGSVYHKKRSHHLIDNS
jgi:hypothetical protein